MKKLLVLGAGTADQGAVPGLRRIAKQTGVAMKELYKLFPKGPGKLASMVSICHLSAS